MDRLLLTLTFVLTLIVSVKSQTYHGPQEDIDAILQKVKTFSQFVMDGDAESIALSYTDDGMIFPPGRDIIAGTDGLKEYWNPNPDYPIVFHTVKPVEIQVIADTAYDYGYYEGKSSNPEGEVTAWRGKYTIIWKKVDGDWKIYLDIWNRIRIED